MSSDKPIIDMVKAYQVIGWYRNLPPESIGKTTTISDGAIFSTFEKARKHMMQMARGSIKEIRLPYNDPQIDHLENITK